MHARSLLPGRAGAAATRTLALRFGLTPRPLGRTGLHVAPVGFGGYRVHVDAPLHRQALEEALRAGVNLVDTSTNYTDGGSEQLIGEVLATLCGAVVAREAVVVVTKIGYMQGQALQHARQRGYPEVVEYQRDCWHCIHPEYLADQLAASRQRLGLATIDAVLLHNPEYFFIDRRNRGGVDAAAREEFYRRVQAAFAWLEEAAARGEIGWYGVSSNSFAAADDDRTDLRRMLALARELRGDAHRFAVAQMPCNLHELAALAPDGPIAAAAAAGVGVLTNRPLNAFLSDPPRMIRLADVAGPQAPPRDPGPLLREVQRREDAWASGLGRALAAELGEEVRGLFRWGHELERGLSSIRDLGHWLQLRNGVIATHMGQVGTTLFGRLTGRELQEFRGWWEDYGAALQAALDGIEDGYRARAQATLEALGDRLAPIVPEAWAELPTSQRAVLTLLAARPPGLISAVLVGMRRPAYVHDMAALASVRPTAEDAGVDATRLRAAFGG